MLASKCSREAKGVLLLINVNSAHRDTRHKSYSRWLISRPAEEAQFLGKHRKKTREEIYIYIVFLDTLTISGGTSGGGKGREKSVLAAFPVIELPRSNLS